MTNTLHDLLGDGEPDLPPAPRHPGGRHRAERGRVSIDLLILILSIAGVIALVLLALQ